MRLLPEVRGEGGEVLFSAWCGVAGVVRYFQRYPSIGMEFSLLYIRFFRILSHSQ